jgi:hypothetical protein
VSTPGTCSDSDLDEAPVVTSDDENGDGDDTAQAECIPPTNHGPQAVVDDWEGDSSLAASDDDSWSEVPSLKDINKVESDIPANDKTTTARGNAAPLSIDEGKNVDFYYT